MNMSRGQIFLQFCIVSVLAQTTPDGDLKSALNMIKLMERQLQNISDKLSEQHNKIQNQEDTIADQRVELNELRVNTAQQDIKIANLEGKIANQDLKIANQENILSNQDAKIAIQDTKIVNQENIITNQNKIIADQDITIAQQNVKIANHETVMVNQDARITNHEIYVANQNVKIANQDTNIAKQDAALTSLRANIATQIAKLDDRNYANVSCHDVYAQMKSIVMVLTASHKTVCNENQSLVFQTQIDEVKNSLSTLTDKIDELKIPENWKNWAKDVIRNETGHEFIGFDAALQKSIIKAGAGHIIPFNNILQNTGNAFKDGVFTCPIPGMYHFSWTILADPGLASDTSLMLNGEIKRINYATDRTTKQHYSGTVSILLRLRRGDQVWIQMLLDSSNARRNYSFFTGMLLKSD